MQLVLLFDAYFSVGFEVALEHLVDGKLGLLATIAQSQVELNERRVLLHRLLDLLASVLSVESRSDEKERERQRVSKENGTKRDRWRERESEGWTYQTKAVGGKV